MIDFLQGLSELQSHCCGAVAACCVGITEGNSFGAWVRDGFAECCFLVQGLWGVQRGC